MIGELAVRYVMLRFCRSYFILLTWIKRVIFTPCCVCAQSCWALCNPMDCSLAGSSWEKSMGFLQVRIQEWVAISSSRGSSWPRDWTHVSCTSCTGRQILPPVPPRKLEADLLVCVLDVSLDDLIDSHHKGFNLVRVSSCLLHLIYSFIHSFIPLSFIYSKPPSELYYLLLLCQVLI